MRAYLTRASFFATRTHTHIRTARYPFPITARMSTTHADSGKVHFPNAAGKPGEYFEPRQQLTDVEVPPDPSKSLPLSPQRQALVEDIIALYSCKPTIERVKRYSPDCVYDDQFVYANDRYKMACQWYALPKGFKDSYNEGYQVVTNDRDLIQFRNAQAWTFKVIPKTAHMNAIVSLSLDPATIDSDFIQVKFHKDQANDKDYSHEGTGFSFKKFQADHVPQLMNSDEVKAFEADKRADKEDVRRHGTGAASENTPQKNL